MEKWCWRITTNTDYNFTSEPLKIEESTGLNSDFTVQFRRPVPISKNKNGKKKIEK